MLQALLADRFKLTIHRETKNLPIYSLVIAKGGSKLQEAHLDGRPEDHMIRVGRGELTAPGIRLEDFAHILTQQTGRTVVDNTGLKGHYDLKFHWTPDQGEAFDGPGGSTSPESSISSDMPPSIFTAIQEQLGLKLESRKGPVEILVIDHVEKPSEN
jgi:uncharacterized protein (TIGR03435 family)